MISNVKPNREEYTGFQGNVPNWWVMLELSLFLLLLNYNFIRISFHEKREFYRTCLVVEANSVIWKPKKINFVERRKPEFAFPVSLEAHNRRTLGQSKA